MTAARSPVRSPDVTARAAAALAAAGTDWQPARSRQARPASYWATSWAPLSGEHPQHVRRHAADAQMSGRTPPQHCLSTGVHSSSSSAAKRPAVRGQLGGQCSHMHAMPSLKSPVKCNSLLLSMRAGTFIAFYE